MTTRFQVGEKVKALDSTQGMRKGAEYNVAKVETRTTAFGVFVTYMLQRGLEYPLRIINGHLLLEAAQPAAPCVTIERCRRDGSLITRREEAVAAAEAARLLYMPALVLESGEILGLGLYSHLPSALQHARRFAEVGGYEFIDQVQP